MTIGAPILIGMLLNSQKTTLTLLSLLFNDEVGHVPVLGEC